jgi:hypothetical protein
MLQHLSFVVDAMRRFTPVMVSFRDLLSIQTFHSLVSMAIMHVEVVDVDGVNMPALRELKLSEMGCRALGYQALFRSAPQLEKLVLLNIWISEMGERPLFTPLPMANLRYLDVKATETETQNLACVLGLIPVPMHYIGVELSATEFPWHYEQWQTQVLQRFDQVSQTLLGTPLSGRLLATLKDSKWPKSTSSIILGKGRDASDHDETPGACFRLSIETIVSQAQVWLFDRVEEVELDCTQCTGAVVNDFLPGSLDFNMFPNVQRLIIRSASRVTTKIIGNTNMKPLREWIFSRHKAKQSLDLIKFVSCESDGAKKFHDTLSRKDAAEKIEWVEVEDEMD